MSSLYNINLYNMNTLPGKQERFAYLTPDIF